MSFITNIKKATEENEHFRSVLYTGMKSQVVAMNLIPGGEIGKEVHAHVEQLFFVVQGLGVAVVNGEEHALTEGDILVVPPHTEHNIFNRGATPLKLYTVYVPANHIDGRMHATKADADADREDEEFGQAIQ